MTDDCIFTGFPLDPADHLRANEKWIQDKLNSSSSRFLLYAGGRPLMDISDGLKPAYKTSDWAGPKAGKTWDNIDWVFIGNDGDTSYFAVTLTEKMDVAPHEKFIDLRSIALQVGGRDFHEMPSLLARGKMILEWNGRRHYCSCCGHKTRPERGGYVRKCLNDACSSEHFPRTDPVVIMLVTDGDKCLLGRGIGWQEGNYSALAGFMEPGESIEEATRREVFEESGVRVGGVQYIKSQPWPFPSSLMIGVEAEALSTDITVDKTELEDARWFDKSYLQDVFDNGGSDNFRIPPKIAIARHLLEEWLQRD